MGPGVNDRRLIEVIDRGHEPILELLLRRDPDVAQDGACELGEEALDEVQPRAVRRGEGKLEPAGWLRGNPRTGLPGDVSRMVVENQVDRRIGR